MSTHGKVIFKYGCMGSGKSLLLLATANNFSEHSIPFLIFKSSIDTREDENRVTSRNGQKRSCVTINPDDDLYSIVNDIMLLGYNIVEPIKWLLVDEAQFLTEKQVDELAAIADNLGINIICYGLRTDFQTHLFPGSKRLFEIADSFEEIKSSCYCNGKTIFNARVDLNREIITNGEQVEIGGDDRYVSLCRKCYFEKTGNKNYKNNY